MTSLLILGTTEIIIIAVIVLLLFGGKKLPELMRGLGQGMQSFKKGMKEPLDDEQTSNYSKVEKDKKE